MLKINKFLLNSCETALSVLFRSPRKWLTRMENPTAKRRWSFHAAAG